MSYNVIFTDELYHHGIKGQKWGIRRYRNKDGTLTESGKKRLSKKYKKLATKAEKSVAANENKVWVNAYNKSANIMNNGGIDKFNREQRKKYGKNFANRKGYETDYEKLFNNTFKKIYSKDLYETYKNDKYFQKAQSLVKEYEMTKWNDMAKANESAINKLKKSL